MKHSLEEYRKFKIVPTRLSYEDHYPSNTKYETPDFLKEKDYDYKIPVKVTLEMDVELEFRSDHNKPWKITEKDLIQKAKGFIHNYSSEWGLPLKVELTPDGRNEITKRTLCHCYPCGACGGLVEADWDRIKCKTNNNHGLGACICDRR